MDGLQRRAIEAARSLIEINAGRPLPFYTDCNAQHQHPPSNRSMASYINCARKLRPAGRDDRQDGHSTL